MEEKCAFLTFNEIIPSILGGPRAEYDIMRVITSQTIFDNARYLLMFKNYLN